MSEALAIESPEPSTYENDRFKDVAFNEYENRIIVTGKARVFEGVFGYMQWFQARKFLKKIIIRQMVPLHGGLLNLLLKRIYLQNQEPLWNYLSTLQRMDPRQMYYQFS